jgi:predicted aspartyl protease
MKRSLVIMLIILSSCTLSKIATIVSKEKVDPISFKTSIPIQIGKQIYITTYWGKNRKKKILILDTGTSFTTADSSTTSDKELSKLIGKAPFGAKTPEGKKIDKVFYSTEILSFGDVSFKQVAFMETSLSNFSDAFYDNIEKPVGLFGGDLLSKGVWKINFKDSILTFASSADSIENLNETTEIPIYSSLNGLIYINAIVKNSITQKLTIDFGFGGMILLPKDIFDNIDNRNEAVLKDTLIATLASKSKITKRTLQRENVMINNKNYSTQIITFDNSKMSLIGLNFFKQFDFVVIDYSKKKLYLSK